MFLDVFEMTRMTSSSQPTHSPHFLPPSPSNLPQAQTKRIPLVALLKDLQCFFFKEHNQWLASQPAFHISYFFLCRKLSTRGGRRPLQKPPRTSLPREKRRLVGAIPCEGEGGSPACQNFEEALIGWSQVLEDYGESLLLTEEWWQHLTILVIYSYLFFHSYLIFHQIIVPIFISSWSFSAFLLLMEIFFCCKAWGSWGRQPSWNAMQPM